MMHAVTANVTFDFYENPEKLSEEQRNAIQNLENLMNQFMGMDFSNEAPGAAVAAAGLAMQITKAQRQGGPLGQGIALQEFIAWSLTNQALGESLRTSKVRTPLMKLVFKSMQALRRMLGLPTGQMLDMFSNISYNTGALIQMTV